MGCPSSNHSSWRARSPQHNREAQVVYPPFCGSFANAEGNQYPPRWRIEHFLGDRLLTADNNGNAADAAILDQLNVSVRPRDQRGHIAPRTGSPGCSHRAIADDAGALHDAHIRVVVAQCVVLHDPVVPEGHLVRLP